MRREVYVVSVVSVISMILERIRSIHYEELLFCRSVSGEVYSCGEAGVKVRELENVIRQSATAD